MKKKYLLSFFTFIITLQLSAQTNSVTLKDGGGVTISSHNSIGDAYGAIPSTISQAYIIEINSTYTGANETFPVTFTAKAGASAANTITLRPEATVTSVSVAGTASGDPLLMLDDADFIRVDGRPGGVGTTRALTFDNQGTSTSSSSIRLQNGACNNVFSYLNITGYRTASSGGRGIQISTSTNVSGNSDNRFEFLKFDGGLRYYMNSSGTAANPNRNLTIYGCEFINQAFCGWWQQNGTGKVHLDSNFFYCTVPSGTSSTGSYSILSDSQIDTILMTRNHIYNIDNSSNATYVYGMCFRSFNAGAVLRAENNFISLMAANPSSNSVIGIELGTVSANNPVYAEFYHNTIRVGGTATGGTAGSVGSAGFQLDASNAGSTLTGNNNIFINERTGGSEQHLATSLITTLGTITSNYNVFKSATADFARIGTTVFPDFATYAAAVAPADANSHDNPVFFVSNDDLHLTGSSIGDASLAGVSIVGVSTDIDGQPRALPYRGADEAGCSGEPVSDVVFNGSPALLCEGDPTFVSVVYSAPDLPGIYAVQWQRSSDGSVFTDVNGANADTLHLVATTTEYYRYILRCQSTGDSIISQTEMLDVTPLPSAGSLSHLVTAQKTIQFTASGSEGTGYTWKFGDGQQASGTDDTITHVYADTGTYEVTVIVSNDCGSDSTTLTIVVTDFTGIAGASSGHGLSVFPNPANEMITIRSVDNHRIRTVELYDLRGALLSSQSYAEAREVRFETSAFASGTYLLMVTTDDGLHRQRLQIAK